MAALVGVATGAAVGLTAFYLARVALGRDLLRLEPPEGPPGGARG